MTRRGPGRAVHAGLLLPLAVCACWAAASTALASSWTVGIVGGFVAPDEELAGPRGPSIEPTFGLRAAGPVRGRFGWSIDALWTEIETETFAGDAGQLAGRGALEIELASRRGDAWIVSLGGGYTQISFDAAEDFWSNFVSAGIGQRIHVGDRAAYRWEFRTDRTLADDGLRGEDVTTAQFLFSVNWGRRGRAEAEPVAKPRDADGDGVPDESDRCPATPPARPVDPHGCPLDADRDGVPDAVDDCRNTPAGLRVDARGCHADGDGDGVPDELDRCPRTIRGIEVTADGCFVDADRDGVYDGLGMDKCPATPAGARVDVHGCPLDGDGDGVYDGLDRCPASPAGQAVDAAGCP